MQLNTERLMLIPLTLDHLSQAIEDRRAMAKSLQLDGNIKQLDDIMVKIYNVKIAKIEQNPNQYQFYTYWQMVLKENNRIIGELGFKGLSRENNLVEVGYGTNPDYQGKGYMTEALGAIIAWACTQDDVEVNGVIASTLKANIPSQKVLAKVGMTKILEDEKYYYWKIERVKYLQSELPK